MNGVLLLCISKKLLYVTLSATESEYVGLSEAIKPILFFKEFLEELGENQGSIPIGNDNLALLLLQKTKDAMLDASNIFGHVSIGFRTLPKNNL